MLNNTWSFITGASGGIGSAIAELFAKKGSNLVLWDKHGVEYLEEIKKRLTKENDVKVHIFFGDVFDYKSISSDYKYLSNQKIIPNTVVTCAGIMNDSLLSFTNEDNIINEFKINTFGTIYHIKESSKLMMRQKTGSIIAIGSIIGENGNAGQSIYSSTKSSVIGFVKSIAKEFGPIGIRANVIAPGLISTALTAKYKDEYIKEAVSSIPMKRIGKPEDVAKVALFLASDLSEYVTGQVIGVDGGMII